LKIFNGQLLRTILPSTERISEDEARGAYSKNKRRKNARHYLKEKSCYLTDKWIWVGFCTY